MTSTLVLDVDRTESATGWWEMARARPRPELAPWVRDICGYQERSQATVERLEIACSHLPVILSFGDRIEVDVPSRPRQDVESFAVGLYPGSAVTRHRGGQLGIQLNLTPLGAYRIFGVPGSALAGELAPLAEVAPALGGPSFQDRLASLPTWEARLGLVDEALLSLARSGPEPDPMVGWMWRQLHASRGQVRVSDLVEETGRSHRHVTSRFRTQVGLAPKALAGIIRFEHAARAVASGAAPLADVAAAHGYADQSHLNRDFARLAGCSPTKYLATVNSVQARETECP